MNNHIKEKIITLSDIDYIQKDWSKRFEVVGAVVGYGSQIFRVLEIKKNTLRIGNNWMGSLTTPEHLIFIPGSINIKTGNYQIDDLIMFKLNIKSAAFESNYLSFISDNMALSRYTHFIKKLHWINEII